ncbi:MgtC/SapB family protein [Mycobacterium camsae]|uniref:MgtC/SapB family protein n=1 Tax=Mycobacterium gordonae TaxID=1778 RepID=UPI001F1202FE|nr:MgtC/SapB family protein [Mycobacterium gordonae]
MAGSQAASTDRDGRADQVATPLPVAVTAAGLVSAVHVGPEAARSVPPQIAQWDAIRSHYPAVADWIDGDAAGRQAAAAATDVPAGRMSRAGVVDYLGTVNSSADAVRWLTTRPDYWVTAGSSVDVASMAVAEFRQDYEHAAMIGPINIYRRCAPGRQA